MERLGAVTERVEGEMEGGAGSAPTCLTFQGATDLDSPTGASTDDKLSPERGRGYPEVTQHLGSRLFPEFLSPQGSFPRKLRAQERVK